MRRRCFSVLGSIRGIVLKPCDPDAPVVDRDGKAEEVRTGPRSRTRVRPGFHPKRPRQVHR